MFSPLNIVKHVVSGAVGLGTIKIVGNVIKAYVNPETLVDKVTMVAGAWAIGGVVASATRSYTDEVVDEVAEALVTVIDAVKTGTKLGDINKKYPTLATASDEDIKAVFESVGLNHTDFAINKKRKWSKIAKTEEQILSDKLAKIDLGVSSFEKEELDRDHFYQDPNIGGIWVPIKL